MVRLKEDGLHGLRTRKEFQFHNGTIKSKAACTRFKYASEFQFHNGTIKRINGLHTGAQIENFNSTMVRLKVYCLFLPIIVFSNFNSTMVRLKASSQGFKDGSLVKFQFHNGTIKSISDKIPVTCHGISIPQWYD